MDTIDPILVLIIDDNPGIHEDFRKILCSPALKAFPSFNAELMEETEKKVLHRTHNIIMDSAFQGEDGVTLVKRAIANKKKYYIAFVDIRMPPGLDGVETIQKIWAIDPHIQTVICTAFSDYSWEEIFEKLGTTDRLLILKKPFDFLEVQQCAQTLIRKYQLTSEIRQQIHTLHKIVNERTEELENSVKKLQHHATHDVLTDLPNRSLFQDRLNQLILRSKHSHLPFTVLFMDINRFKEINDTLGHSFGDIILKEIAKRLKMVINENDTVARFGGDEFTILLSTIHNEPAIIAFIHKVIEALATPFQIKEHQLFVTPSIGISIYPRDGSDAETLIKHADIAMYKAKKLPHKYFQFYSEDINKHAVEQLEIETDLIKALEQNSFLIHYQPLIDLKTGTTVGMEALLRWHHPKLGLIPPQKFIPIAEETGLIVAIGEWVLETACAQTKKWQDEGLPHINIAVNCSALQIEEIDALAVIHRVLEKTKLAPKYLELELTESQIIKNSKDISAKLKNLKKLGVQLVIDDFGTGYSSFSYLGSFPIDKIKVDQIFVSNIKTKKNPEVLLALIAIGHALNLKVLAEGVETQEQLDFLRKYNCDELQGLLFSEPLPVDKATEFLKSKKQQNIF